MTRIITADEARALAAKWKGYDGPYGVSWDDEGDCVVHYDDMTVARVAHFDGGHTEPLARLFAAAPDDVKALAATVVAQAADNTVLRARAEAAERERDAAIADAARLRADLDAAWEAIPFRGAVRGMVTLAEVVAGLVEDRDQSRSIINDGRAAVNKHLAAIEETRAALVWFAGEVPRG